MSENKNRQFFLSTGKWGIIEFECAILRENGNTEEEIKAHREKRDKEIPDGTYRIY
jgi:hypothetical protein